MFNSSEGSQEEGEVCPHHKQRTHEEYHKDRNSQGRAMMGNKNRLLVISTVWWIGIRDIINKALELIDNYYVDKNCQGKECWATEAGNILSCTKFIRNVRWRKVLNIYLYYIGTGEPMVGNLQVL